jgi:membrane-associated phospholipid phosphatase
MKPFRRWLLAFALAIVAISFCVAYIDRPVTDYFEAHVRHTPLWNYLDYFLAPFLWTIVAALFMLFSTGCLAIFGHQPPRWTRTPILCSWSTMWGLATETMGKGISGRTLPDPSYVQSRVYSFRFLLGDPHGSSFPSGHMLIACGIATVLWIQTPRLRWPVSLLACAIGAALIIDNFHWVSDVIAGAFLGVSVGWMTVRLQTVTSLPTR